MVIFSKFSEGIHPYGGFLIEPSVASASSHQIIEHHISPFLDGLTGRFIGSWR